MALKPRLVIAGAASGVGKTTVMVALGQALKDAGLRLATFKCGPDYLDPTYHLRVTGRPSPNLDGWMMGRAAVLATFARASHDADLVLIEGMMGLFDGASATSEEGSTAEIAKWLDAPVIAVLDASGLARTVAAIAHGFTSFDPALKMAGIICNRVGSEGHLALLREAVAHYGGPPIVGGLPLGHEFPERHLGLRQADETVLSDSMLAEWGRTAARWCDLTRIVELARSAPPQAAPAPAQPPRCRIGLAWDRAFHFYYEDNLRRLEALGAQLIRFSPLADSHLSELDGIYLGGGYPELFAAELAANHMMRAEIAAFVARGGVIYAECGGLMYLCDAIKTLDGRSHPMLGVLAGVAEMRPRLQALGYVSVRTTIDTPLGPAGLDFRGHQFRYSELAPAPSLANGVQSAYQLTTRFDRAGEAAGYRVGNVLASYVHAHWASNPAAARGLVATCAARAATVESAPKLS